MKKTSCLLLLLVPLVSFVAFGQASMPFQHPRDQIALQLGAIQMGYAVPFRLSPGDPANAQQAANALVMGRNALDATVSKPAVKVAGAVNSPAVDTVEYRDQLYQAVEAVVTSPMLGTIKGSVNLEGGRRQTVTGRLTLPTIAYTIPVPYAVESATSVDAQGILSGEYSLPANSIGSLQIAPGAIRSTHLAPGSLSSMEVVTQNTTALPNRSYFVSGEDVTLTLPSNAAIGEMVAVYGKGGKVKPAPLHGISRWTFHPLEGVNPSRDARIFCSADANKIYVSTQEKIFASRDAGKSWSELRVDARGELEYLSLVYCSDDGETLLLGDRDGERGPYLISRNAGSSWSPLNLGSAPRQGATLSPDGSVIFQFGPEVETGENSNFMKYSTDGGQTWVLIALPNEVEVYGGPSLKFSADGRTIVFYDDNLGTLFISNDMGGSWINGLVLGDRYIFSVSRDGKNIVVLGDDYENEMPRRRLSENGGASWMTLNLKKPSIFYEDYSSEYVPLVGFQNGKILFQGLLKSYNKGANWSLIPFQADPYSSYDSENNFHQFVPVCSSFEGDRLIGFGTADSNLGGIYTSWTTELDLDGDRTIQMVYLGNGNWRAQESN